MSDQPDLTEHIWFDSANPPDLDDQDPPADSERRCYRCGRTPAAGWASIWTAKDGEQWYCHGDDQDYISCYETEQIGRSLT